MRILKTIKKGDIVARRSYQKDVIFVVDMVIDDEIAILTGITTRLKADEKIDKTINNKEIIKNSFLKRSNRIIYTGKILHLDGDSCLDNKTFPLT